MLSRNAPPHKRRGALRDDTKHGCVEDDLFPSQSRRKQKEVLLAEWQCSVVREKRCAKSILKIFKKCLNVLALDCRFKTNKQTNKRIAPCKGIQYSLGFWIPPCGFRTPSTRFQYLSVELEFWISNVSGIPDSLSCTPDSKTQDFEFYQQNFPGLRNPNSLIWGDKKKSKQDN